MLITLRTRVWLLRASRARVGNARLLGALAALAVLTVARPSAGAGLDKAAERWLREVHLLILPEEEAAFRALATSEDRKEFERIFWARRDPDPTTAKNEMEEAVAVGRKRADDLFTSPRERGSETGCGQVFLLLGEPLEVEGREIRERFNNLRDMKEGARRPEAWTYRSRPGDPVGYTAGELRISFDEDCRFSEAGRVLDDLRRVAQSRIIRPGLSYRTTPDGHLVRLADLLRESATVAAHPPLDPSRRDFPLALEPKVMLRTQAGLGYVAGLFRADLSGLAAAATDASGAEGIVQAEALLPSGTVAGKTERAFKATADPSALVASYGLTLKPGAYTVRVSVRLSGGQVSSATVPLEVPDFEAQGLRSTPLILYPDEPGAPGPKDAFAAMTVGPLHLRPRFGDGFRATDSLQVVAILFGGDKDPATGKCALRASFSILKDGKAVAKGQDQVFETPSAVASVGPIPLAGFSPGRYVVRLEGKDERAGTSSIQEKAFELRP